MRGRDSTLSNIETRTALNGTICLRLRNLGDRRNLHIKVNPFAFTHCSRVVVHLISAVRAMFRVRGKFGNQQEEDGLP